MRVLLIEPDAYLADMRRAELQAEAVQVVIVSSGTDALAIVQTHPFDVLVLSLVSTDPHGLAAIRALRAVRAETPMLALAPPLKRELQAAARSAGAVAVGSLQISSAELLARMRVIVRRRYGYGPAILQVGDVCLDRARREVGVLSAPVRLSPKELAVLELLMLRRNVVLTKEIIHQNLYENEDNPPALKIIDVFICNIRRQLAASGVTDLIGSVWGRGYTISDPGRDFDPPDLIPSSPFERRPAPFEFVLA